MVIGETMTIGRPHHIATMKKTRNSLDFQKKDVMMESMINVITTGFLMKKVIEHEKLLQMNSE